MKKLLPIIMITVQLAFMIYHASGQEKIQILVYGKTEIPVPEGCSVKSAYEILDCNGFSAQWLFLNDEMIDQGIDEQILLQMEEQMAYKSKKAIKFTSQKQKFEGTKFRLKDGSTKIIGFGKVDGIPLILNLGFENEPKKNDDLTDFEKLFISF